MTLRLLFLTAIAHLFIYNSAFSFRQNLDSLYHTAVAQQRAERYREAMATLQLLLRQQPHHHDARNLLGRVLALQGEFQQALQQYDSVLAEDRTNVDARFGKGLVLAWMKQYPEATALIGDLHREDPSNKEYLLQLGNIALWSNHPDRAYGFYEQAYRLDFSSVDILRGLARSSLQMGDYQRALEWYREVLRYSQGDPEARSEILRLTYSARHEVQVHWVQQTIENAETTQNTTMTAEYYNSVNRYWKPYLHISRVVKFAETQVRYGVGVYGRPQTGTGLFAQLLVSPAATVLPRFDATVELDQLVSRGIEVVGSYRYLSFAGSAAHILSPAVTLYPFEWLWLTPRLYLSRSSSGSSTAGVLTVFVQPMETTVFRLGVTSGDESFRATVLSEILSVRSRGVLIGAKARLHRNVALEGLYQYTARQGNVQVHEVTVLASFLW
jgi:YaiO family outer membrane protein